jgi:hypothetical protein
LIRGGLVSNLPRSRAGTTSVVVFGILLVKFTDRSGPAGVTVVTKSSASMAATSVVGVASEPSSLASATQSWISSRLF